MKAFTLQQGRSHTRPAEANIGKTQTNLDEPSVSWRSISVASSAGPMLKRKSQDQIKKEWNQRLIRLGASERFQSPRVLSPSIGECKARHELKMSARKADAQGKSTEATLSKERVVVGSNLLSEGLVKPAMKPSSA